MFSLSENVKELLIQHNMDAKTLSIKINISYSVISDTLNNKKIPNIQTLLKICKFFNCSIDFLLGRTNNLSTFYNNALQPFKIVFNNLLILNKTNINRVSNETGIRTTNIYRWLNDINYPSTDSLIKLADYFSCSVDYLVGIER